MPQDPPAPRRLSSRSVYRGHTIEVLVDRLQRANGHSWDMDVVRHPGAAAVVATDAAQHVLLVRQLRYPIGQALLELPAGRLDPGETPQQCAGRELEEEAGCRAGRLVSLGAIWPTPGFCDERVHLFWATDLQVTQQQLDAEEEVTVVRMPLHDALAQAQDGRLQDAKTLVGLFRLAGHLGR